jgi:phosphoribosylglycinamide formyltransferase 1
MTPVGVLVSGRGSNLAALIDRTRLRASPFDIACVVSDNPEAGALTLARNAGIPAFVHEKLPGQKKREYEQAIVERLRAHGVRVVALAGFMRILGETLLSAFPGRVLNIHPSLLPAFPGLHAQEQAHAAGVRFAGCTVHVVDAGTDTGPILDQACFRIPGDMTAQALSLKILEHEHRLYPETLARFCRHEFALVEGRVRSFAPPAPLRPAWESFSASHFAQEPPPAPDPGRVRVAVSACLCGFPCRYDGAGRFLPDLVDGLAHADVLPVCPEVLAGLGVPRPRIQFENEPEATPAQAPLIRDEHGSDVTDRLLDAVDRITGWCRDRGVRVAFLKENSPSCGTLRIPWRGQRVPGPGPLAGRLARAGVRVFTEEDFVPGLNALGIPFHPTPESREQTPSRETGKDENSL